MTAAPLNPLRPRLARGDVLLGTIVSMPSPHLTQVLAGCGLDWILIDQEHGLIGPESLLPMVAATTASGCVPIARVAWNVPWLVKPALDAGALGIVFPMIRSGAEAQQAISSCLYPPRGERGWGPFYAPGRWGITAMDYTMAADDAVLRIALIEHVDAVQNIDSILATPGLDVAIIAPFDLSTSIGKPGQFEDTEFAALVARAEQAILASSVVLGGLAATAGRANEQIARGYRFILLAYDVLLIQNAMNALIKGIGRKLA